MDHKVYTGTEKAMAFGSYLALKDPEKVANLYFEEFGWPIHPTIVNRIVERYELTKNFARSKGAGPTAKFDAMEEEILVESLISQNETLSKTIPKIQKQEKKTFT